MKKITHYDTLGVAQNAPDEVIRAAYKALAQKNHPDKNIDNPNATNIMQTINQAYDVLSDPLKRRDYDATLIRQEPPVRERAQGSSQGSQRGSYTQSEPTYPPAPESGGVGALFLIAFLAIAAFAVFFIFSSYSHNGLHPAISAIAPPPYPAPSVAGTNLMPAFVPKETSPQELAVCIFTAAKTYDVPPQLVLSLLSAEGGAVGEKLPGAGRTYDLGLMHINSSWVPQLAGVWGVDERTGLRMLRDDACINVGVGAWILHATLDKNASLQNEIAAYHAAAHHLSGRTNDAEYVNRVMKMMELYKSINSPEDLIGVVKK